MERRCHLKSTKTMKCIILTDLAHEVINLHVYMIQRTHSEKWIVPTAANESVSYTTEYWLGLSACIVIDSFYLFQKKRLLIFLKILNSQYICIKSINTDLLFKFWRTENTNTTVWIWKTSQGEIQMWDCTHHRITISFDDSNI